MQEWIVVAIGMQFVAIAAAAEMRMVLDKQIKEVCLVDHAPQWFEVFSNVLIHGVVAGSVDEWKASLGGHGKEVGDLEDDLVGENPWHDAVVRAFRGRT